MFLATIGHNKATEKGCEHQEELTSWRMQEHISFRVGKPDCILDKNCNANNSNILSDQTSTKAKKMDCAVCLEQHPAKDFYSLISCGHKFCKKCIKTHVRISISESRVEIPCPLCKTVLHPEDIKKTLQNEQEVTKYERFMVRRVLMQDPDSRWCPAPNCE